MCVVEVASDSVWSFFAQGQALFKGLQVHSRNLQDPSLIQGQAVVIVGEGQQAAAEYAAKLSVTAGFKQLVLVQTKKVD